MKTIALMTAALSLGACVTVPMPPYAPQSSQTLGGSIYDVQSYYTPKKGVAANQIRNTAVGSILTTVPVSDYITNGFRLELRAAGVRLGEGPCRMSLTVRDYAAEDLGFNVTFKSDIGYALKSPAGDYARDVEKSFTTDKFQDTTIIYASLQNVIAQNFDDVLRDPAFKAKLGSCTTSAPVTPKPTS